MMWVETILTLAQINLVHLELCRLLTDKLSQLDHNDEFQCLACANTCCLPAVLPVMLCDTN